MTDHDAMTAIEVTNNRDLSRFEAHQDGALVGVLDYVLRGDVITFTHTGVPEALRGRGIAAELVAGAIGQARAEGAHEIVPQCSYVQRWMKTHDA